MQIELLKHREKLLKLTKLSVENLDELQNLVTGNVTFINEKLLPEKLLQSTEILLQNIDTSDTVFVALTKQLQAKLWTGDMQLYKGLKTKKFKEVITTTELSLLLDHLEE